MYRQGFNIFKQCLKTYANVQSTERRHIARWVAPTLRILKKRRDRLGPPKPEPRSAFIEWNYDAEIYAFGKRLNEEFDEATLRRALTHRSYARNQEEKDGIKIDDNSDLIERGNAIIARYLQQEFRKSYPDVLADVLKNHLTTVEMLAFVASHIGLRDIVLCSDFPVEDLTLADTFPAVVAALEASSGLEKAEIFIKDFLIAQLNGKDVYDLWKIDDAYGYLKTMLKDQHIEPRLCNWSGVNTILANYQVGLYSDKKLLGIGFGETVEIAKHTAALDAVQRIYSKYTPSN